VAQLTIKGQIFDINDDPRITVGTPLDEGMVIRPTVCVHDLQATIL